MALKGIAYSIMPTRAYLYLRWGAYKYQYGSAFPLRQNDRTLATSEGYSLKPYDDTKSIFIHIPKCAGVSVCRTLYGCLAGGHTTLDEYLQIFEPTSIYNYFKFTIVRNPWDRLASAYHFLKGGGFSETDKIWFDKELGHYKDFTDFCINWVNSSNIWKYYHFRPQYHFIVDKHQKITLDFIGYLENIGDDFKYIANTLGKDVSLSKINASNRHDYKDSYNKTTREIVARVYQRDINLLGYSYDNANIRKQIEARDRGLAATR